MAKMVLLMAAAAVQMLPNTAKADTALNQTVKPAAPVELSDWLLSQPLVAERYPLGLFWATPEAKAQQQLQQEKWLTRLEQLRVQGRISANVWLSMQRMMRAMPPSRPIMRVPKI